MTALPPRWLDKLATKICAPHLREELLGDLHERYALRHKRSGARKAKLFYAREVLGLLRPSVVRRKPSSHGKVSLLNPEILSSYFKIGSRVLLKNRGYSLIHITGLAIGLWACMMVATVVIDSLSYDRQWSRTDDIYRIVGINDRGSSLLERSASSPAPLAQELMRNYPEVEACSSIETELMRFRLRPQDSDAVEASILTADSTIKQILDFKLVAGSFEVPTDNRWKLLITRSFASRIFPGQNPVGRTIYQAPNFGSEASPYEITGLIEDLPYNSQFRADVIQLKSVKHQQLVGNDYIMFTNNYLLLKRGTDVSKFTGKVNQWYAGVMKNNRNRFEFQPLKDVYLHSDFAEGQKVRASAKTIYIFAGVAFLLLFIACVNFINLSIAKAAARVKEAGVRKLLSGSRSQLVIQLLTETMLLFGISICIASLSYVFSLQSVENFLGHKLAMTFTSNLPMTAAALLIAFLTAILTGLYPAFVVSGSKPGHMLQGKFNSSLGQNGLRKTLVVAQFSISVIVLVATIVVRQQLDLMKNKEPGYDKNNLMGIEQTYWNGKGEAFKNELQRIPGVVRSSLSMWMPADGAGHMQREVKDPANPNQRLRVWYVAGDVDLPATLGLKLLKGRTFSDRFADAVNTDSLQKESFEKFENAQKNQNSLMTATAAKMLGITQLDVQNENAHSVPVGVVGDFHNESFYEPMKPTLILAQKSPEYAGMLIRIQPGTEIQVGTAIRKLWKQFFPEKSLRISNIEDKLAKQYEAESKLHQLFMFFSGLTMFLSALGIFGLVVQAAEQRAKEVGIRKVLGASVSGIIALLSTDFVKMVLIAIAIASPLAWFALERWLEHYPYRTTLSWWIFAATGLATLAVTIFTVSFQAIRAAMADPVRSLRNE